MKLLLSAVWIFLSVPLGCTLSEICTKDGECPDGTRCDEVGRCARVVEDGGREPRDAGVAVDAGSLVDTDAGIDSPTGDAVARDVIGHVVRRGGVERVSVEVPLSVESTGAARVSAFVIDHVDVGDCAVSSVSTSTAHFDCPAHLLGDVRAVYRAVLDDGTHSSPAVATLRFLPSDWDAKNDVGLPVRARRMRLEVSPPPEGDFSDTAVFLPEAMFPADVLLTADSFSDEGDEIGREHAVGGVFHEVEGDFDWLYFDEIVSDAQDDVAELWEDFAAVWHLEGLDDAATSVEKSDGANPLDGTLVAAAGKLGDAALFPASILQSPLRVSTEAGTFSTWVKSDDNTQTAALISATGAGGVASFSGANITLGLSLGRPVLVINPLGFPVALTADSPLDGEWHHVAGAWTRVEDSEMALALYVNGERIKEITMPFAAFTSATVRVGRMNDNGLAKDRYVGLLDDVRIANVMREPADVALEVASATSQRVLTGITPVLHPVASLVQERAAPGVTLSVPLAADEREGTLMIAVASALLVDDVILPGVILEGPDIEVLDDNTRLTVYRCELCRPRGNDIQLVFSGEEPADVVVAAVQFVGAARAPLAIVPSQSSLAADRLEEGAHVAAIMAGAGPVTLDPGGYRVASVGTEALSLDVIFVPVDPSLVVAGALDIVPRRASPGALIGYRVGP